MGGNSAMKVFYLHIPKTGGQTLATRIASAFPIGRSDIIGSRVEMPNGLKTLNQLFINFDFVEKHVRGSVLNGERSFSVLSTFREPTEQIVSNYLHIKREPRNYLYRPANELPPEVFFRKFGDILGDFQTKRLFEAFNDEKYRLNNTKYAINSMFSSLDMIRWVVPTEFIDDFVDIWAIENRRYVPARDAVVNVANRDDKYSDLISIVSEMPCLYSLDLVLWIEAKVRYSDYRAKVFESVLGDVDNNNLSLAYSNHGDSIWLQSGWYSPMFGDGVGLAWWSGPDCFSEIRFKRTNNSRYLHFSIVVFCGVAFSEIVVLNEDRQSKLVAYWKQIGESRWDVWVDLVDLADVGLFFIWVPEVWSPAMVNKDSNDFTRQGIATCDWDIVNDLPNDVSLK